MTKNDEINNIITFADEPIFNFLNPNDNNELSKMRGTNLQELIILLDEYYLELRNKLNLDENITFGLEIEFENANKSKINQKLLEAFPNKEWKIVEDTSLKKW